VKRRCSAESDARREPMVGTASTVTAFLLVECEGPWGIDAMRDSRLPQEVKRWMRSREGIRPLLIRRGPTKHPRVFLSRGGRVTTIELDSITQLPDIDLEHDPSTYDGQLFLVCTHGRHDVCCAERGRPLWKELQRVAPDETWQVSHIGGDRFAANVLVLPHGLYYGRIDPDDAESFVETHRAGQLDLDHLRGRSAYPFEVQAAEVFLRRELGETDVRPLPIRDSNGVRTTFEVGDRAFEVEVERRTTSEVLTCRSDAAGAGWTFHPVAVREVRGHG